MRFHLLFTRLAREDRGVALVEFALVLPLLLLIFAMTIEGGRMMWSYQSALAGVRDAARYIGRVTPSDICVTGDTLDPDHESQAASRVTTSGVAGDVEILEVRTTLDPCPSEDGPYRVLRVATVTVEADVEIRFPMAGVFQLIGSDLGTITTTIADHTRVFGS